MGTTSTILHDGLRMPVYVAMPRDPVPAPGVVVMIHGPGLDHFIQTKVDELAAHGFVAASPDLFHRQPEDSTDTMGRIARLRDDEIIADVDATVRYLHDLAANPLAIIGFCMGGRNTYLLAGARPQYWRAAGVFYGGNIMKAWGDGPSPFERTAHIGCPMLGQFGADDTNPTPADVAAIDAALTRHGKPHEFHTYEGAGHAFLNFANAERHRPAQAAIAWQRMLAFLDHHLRP